MSVRKEQPDQRSQDDAPSTPSSVPSPREMNSGRVSFDARGNAVWEWRTGEGEFKSDASTTILRQLEPEGLAIEATGILKPPGLNSTAKAEEPTAGALAESAPPPVAVKEAPGSDPYNSSRSPSHVRAAATQRSAPRKPAQPAPEPQKQGLFGRLLGRR